MEKQDLRIRRKLIVKLAAEALTRSGIFAPHVNIGKVAKAYGLEIIRQNADPNVSGFLIKGLEDGSGIIGVNSSHTLNRQRFTIAHEIGHFLLHNYQGVHFDRESTALQIYNRDNNSSTGLDHDEREANLFAAELLMPRDFVQTAMDGIDSLTLLDQKESALDRLAKQFRVSITAMTYRLAYLKYLEI
jgi:Zn-dependent peptidase ImmA (M78 family)